MHLELKAVYCGNCRLKNYRFIVAGVWCMPVGKRLSPVAQAFVDFIREERSVISAIAKRFDVTDKLMLNEM